MGRNDVIPPIPVDTKSITAATVTTPSVSNAWRLGTLLDAIALQNSVDGRVRLQIGARTVTAQTSLPLAAGQALRLQVAETGRTVVLRMTANPPPADPVREGIRQAMPRQAAQAPLMALVASAAGAAELPAALKAAAAQLAGAMRNPDTMKQAPGLRLAVRDSGLFLEKKLAVMPSLRPAAVRSDWKAALLRFRDRLAQLQIAANRTDPSRPAPAPQNAGGNPPPAGAESRVAIRAATPVVTMSSSGASLPLPNTPTTAGASAPPAAGQAGPDSGLSTRTGPPPPMRQALPAPQPALPPASLPADPLSLVGDLLRHSDAALARVRLNQLGSVAPEQGARMVWLLELPVRHADQRFEVVTLRIERDEAGAGSGNGASWTVDLAFDLGIKGVLRARLALRAERIFGSFWADTETTRTEVLGALPALREAMEEKRLHVGCLSCGAEAPDDPPIPDASLLETTA